MTYPCNTCIEKSRCKGGKASCKSLADYKEKRRRDVKENQRKWKNG